MLDCTIYVVKTKVLICAFVLAYAKSRFSHDVAHVVFLFQERIEYSKTFKGKYFNFLGYFFSIYCVWKIFIVSVPSESHIKKKFMP